MYFTTSYTTLLQKLDLLYYFLIEYFDSPMHPVFNILMSFAVKLYSLRLLAILLGTQFSGDNNFHQKGDVLHVQK